MGARSGLPPGAARKYCTGQLAISSAQFPGCLAAANTGSRRNSRASSTRSAWPGVQNMLGLGCVR